MMPAMSYGFGTKSGTGPPVAMNAPEGRDVGNPGKDTGQCPRRFAADDHDAGGCVARDHLEGIEQVGPDQKQVRPGAGDLVLEEGSPQFRVDRHDDGAGLHGSDEGDEELGAVADQGHDPFAGCYAVGGERGGGSGRTPGRGRRR